MQRTDVVVVGAGQAGLAISHQLGAMSVDHVLFDRGAVAARWITRTWHSLRMLTPNWMNALPGRPYAGSEPNGYMSREETVSYLRDYARWCDAPVVGETEVRAVRPSGSGFHVETDKGFWHARAVVVATGQCDLPQIPRIGAGLPNSVEQLHASQYRAPHRIGAGRILVVGASSSGLQIADELASAGRDVLISVGRHTRVPRRYRGRDIFAWFDRLGILSQPTAEMADPAAAMRQPSLQLAGRQDGADLDLARLQRLGIRLAGRLIGCDGAQLQFARDLRETMIAADIKRDRILSDIDAHLGLGNAARPENWPKVRIGRGDDPDRLDLGAEGITHVIWATGYARTYPWLDVPVFDPSGNIAHRDGVTAWPGLYALGLRLLRKRDSNFLGGVGADAEWLGTQIAAHLGLAVRDVA